jgi:hypothetical protein
LLNSVLVPSGCWLWLGRCTQDGYPLINMRLNGKHTTLRAHRVAWCELGGNPTPDELDHLCHNRACINPAHLRDVPKLTNLANRRGYRSKEK